MINIDQLLKEKGISKTDLAKKMGMSRENLYRIINGNPTLENLEKIANSLGVNLGKLFNDMNGYVELNGVIHKVTCKEDLENILAKVK